MAIPLIPVLIGAAAGAAITYMLMVGRVRRSLADTVQDVGDTVQSKARRVKDTVTDVVDDATDAVKDAVDDATDAVKDAASKVTG